jgi:DNA-directed RNA polymerase specialized sigma24 family protein
MEELALTALDALPFETREILVLNLYAGYRFDEIAAMLGKSPDAIWARASRGRAQLRTIIAEQIASERKPTSSDENAS